MTLTDILAAVLLLIVVALVVTLLGLPGTIVVIAAVLVLVWAAWALIAGSRGRVP